MQNDYGVHAASYPMGKRGGTLLPGVKLEACEADYSPLPSAKVKNNNKTSDLPTCLPGMVPIQLCAGTTN
jgi:hypothetical protein